MKNFVKNNRTKIIAEAGVNHNGSIELAKKLIEVAADAKADYIKFQTFITEDGITKNALKANYQKKDNVKEEYQFAMIKKLELSQNDHYELIRHCNDCGIRFLSTAFDSKSIDFLNSLDLDYFKIPSGEITNFPYLKRIGQIGKPTILSTGMSNLNEIESALDILTKSGTSLKNITVLQCNSEYPTPISDANINSMMTIKNKFKVAVGYSDHTLGIEVPIAAVALGAEIIEKHFTIDKSLSGPDHKASLEPIELKNLVKSIRNTQKALGSGLKEPSKSEIKNISNFRKSLVAKKNIKKGQIFCENNLTTKRPGSGLSPMIWEKIINTPAKKNYEKDELI
jgi:N,N'-diacetyllegionaminate synthase